MYTSYIYSTMIIHLHVFTGMLLRFFMHFYDMEIIDEDIFLKWKEEVNDEYPGKGKALFQVKSYITHVHVVDIHTKTKKHTPSLEFNLKRLQFYTFEKNSE